MADNPILNRVSGFAAQPVTRQMALLIGMAASVALGVGVIQWAMKPDFQPLYGAMSPADNATAVSLLQANGIPYTMAGGSGLLSVPSDQIPQARMALASEGFPRGGGVGFESLYQEQEMGLSSFMEQARYNRAVEAELARTISAMDSVKGARVHVAASKQSAFIRRGQEPSASVMVSLYPGRGLSERQLAGIVHLVASSIPELQASKVSVVDQAGKLLSSQDGEDNDFGYTSEQFRIAQQLEDSLNDRIESILEPILGVGAARAQVTADLDFTRVESTSEQYSPETIMRSEQTTEDLHAEVNRSRRCSRSANRSGLPVRQIRLTQKMLWRRRQAQPVRAEKRRAILKWIRPLATFAKCPENSAGFRLRWWLITSPMKTVIVRRLNRAG
jgi:flagellar M-ring protein FliF